jgi:Ser/Thr protein kinase RdoA (MazF antagonist)
MGSGHRVSPALDIKRKHGSDISQAEAGARAVIVVGDSVTARSMWSPVQWPRPAASFVLSEPEAVALLARFGQTPAHQVQLTPLAKGSNAVSWTLVPTTGQTLVLRCALGNRSRGALDAMAEIARRVADSGITTKVPLAGPDEKYTVLDEAGRPWQCWTWLSGHRPRGSTHEAEAMGSVLRRFHTELSAWQADTSTTHTPYWPEVIERHAILGAVRRLELPPVAGRTAGDVVSSAYDLAGPTPNLRPTPGHNDCHADNFLMVDSGKRAALFDFELVGSRPGAQATDLGVLMHRIARIAAQRTDAGDADRALAAGRAAAALARAYEAPADLIAIAMRVAIRESLAKVLGCAGQGPPGLDRLGRRTIAANHCLYLAELLILQQETTVSAR